MSSLVPNLPRLTIVPKLHLKPGIFTPDNLMHLWTLNIPYSHVKFNVSTVEKRKKTKFYHHSGEHLTSCVLRRIDGYDRFSQNMQTTNQHVAYADQEGKIEKEVRTLPLPISLGPFWKNVWTGIYVCSASQFYR